MSKDHKQENIGNNYPMFLAQNTATGTDSSKMSIDLNLIIGIHFPVSHQTCKKNYTFGESLMSGSVWLARTRLTILIGEKKKKKKEKKHFTRVSSFYEKERMKLYGEEMEQYRKNEMISIFVLVYYPYFEWSRC